MTPPGGRKPKPVLPSNAKSVAQFNREQLQKTADSRGIPLPKLIAQMVQQYLNEENKPKESKVFKESKESDHSKEPLDF